MLEGLLREEAARLLREKAVDVFVGYGPGSLPLRSTPVFLRDPAGADSLVLGPTCENNLTRYLSRFPKERVGVVVKACDARALVELCRENQVDRKRIHVVGVPCLGVISRQRLDQKLGGREVTGGSILGDQVVCSGHGWEANIPLAEVVHPSCAGCRLPQRDLFDVFLGEDPAKEGSPYAEVEAWELQDADQRYQRFSREMEKCLRCYACRQACPACYCPECFVDRSQPAWVGGSDDASEAMVFHLVRTMHVAGRCVDCGACVRACPQGIDLRILTKRVERDARALFDFEPGLDPGHKTLPGSFRPDDPDDFIK
ncbi:MAG: 4Fe-4S ferredoxin [Bacillota bacterium]